MQEILSATAHRKLFLLLFFTCFLVLMFSYYDSGYLSSYQVLFSTFVANYSTYNASPRMNITSTKSSIDLGTTVLLTRVTNTAASTAMKNIEKGTNITTSNSNNITATASSVLPVDSFNFLVLSSKCKMLDLDPFNDDAKRYFKHRKYQSCNHEEPLSYIEKKDNSATLHIDNLIVPAYSRNGINCCFSYVTRKVTEKSPDDHILISECKPFVDSVKLVNDFVYVKCFDNNKNVLVYENVHATVTITENVRKKTKPLLSENATRPISVLFVGVDSVSRLQFIRGLPNTYRYVEENGWLTLKGYNKMDDNTFPNLMAILTGYNRTYAYEMCNPVKVGKLDKCPMLWFDYRNLGYVTGYAEDHATIGTFNYNKKGFLKPPADYYFRSYVLATEKLKKTYMDGMLYCTGPEGAGQRILNLAREFSITMKDLPMFGFFWANTFSHNDINSVTGMDNKLKSFLTDLEHGGVLNTTIVLFLSDHGIRFGDIRMTETGWLEERLPFIYVSFPPWFKEKHRLKYENFKNNLNRFTTPYDLHMTLKHILVLGGLNYTMTPSNACPNCRSLFEEVPKERSCEDAAIEQHWCTCTGYKSTKLPKSVEEKLGKFLLNEIQKVLSNHTECSKYSVNTVLSTRLSQKLPYSNTSSVLVQMKTDPKAIFESTLTYEGDINEGNYILSGDVSRLDYYASHSHCVSSAYLKKYCYCNS